MSAFPTGRAARHGATPPVAPPRAREARPATPSPSPEPAGSSWETAPEAGAGRSRRVVAPAFSPSPEALATYAALGQAIRSARDRGEAVPCLGGDSEAWTSDVPAEQDRAADGCYDCPALALCGRYADLAGERFGTWGGVTRGRRGRARPVEGPRCGCGCGGATKGGRYRSGHDARHLAQLVRYARAGAVTPDGARRALAGFPALQAKFTERFAA